MIVMGWGRGTGAASGSSINLQPAEYAVVSSGYTRITFRPDGQAIGYEAALSGPLTYTWLGAGVATDYEIFCRAVSGTSPKGNALSQWLNLGTERTWYNTNGLLGSRIELSIRRASDAVVIATALIVLRAH